MTLESWQRRLGLISTVRWTMARPLRSIASSGRLPKGRSLPARATRRAAYLCGRAAHHIAWATVEPGSQVVLRTPAGALMPLASDTVIAWSLWLTGEFERQELISAGRLALPGSYAFDVGANVGLFAVDLSRAVGPSGRVIAIEPLAANAKLLRSNLEPNECRNVEVVVAAAGAVAGQVELLLAHDPSQHSTASELPLGQVAQGSVSVPCVTLDDLWRGAGRPPVSFVKIDVEGAEEQVLRGALGMITACRPQMIVEVHGRERVGRLVALLPDYQAVAVPGFVSWNYLFRSARPSAQPDLGVS
jgi:FkbM family methyltransferase